MLSTWLSFTDCFPTECQGWPGNRLQNRLAVELILSALLWSLTAYLSSTINTRTKRRRRAARRGGGGEAFYKIKSANLWIPYFSSPTICCWNVFFKWLLLSFSFIKKIIISAIPNLSAHADLWKYKSTQILFKFRNPLYLCNYFIFKWNLIYSKPIQNTYSNHSFF